MARINAVSFHENPSGEAICRLVRDAGFDSIELSRPPFYYSLTTREARRAFAGWLAELGLSTYGFDTWVDVEPFTDYDGTLLEFQRAIEFAADLDLAMIITHDPWLRVVGDRAAGACMKTLVPFFARLADMAAASGLDVVLEPHPDTLSMDNPFAVALVDTVDRQNFGLLYDCCHYGVGQPDAYVEAIGRLGRRIRHVHFSDGDRSTYALHLPLGEGSLDLDAIVDALKQIGFSGTLTNDLYNYPMLKRGARHNAPRIKEVERQLGLKTRP